MTGCAEWEQETLGGKKTSKIGDSPGGRYRTEWGPDKRYLVAVLDVGKTISKQSSGRAWVPLS